MLGWHAFAAVVVTVCVLAGFWQLGTYGTHQEDERKANASRPAVSLTSSWGPDEPMRDDLIDRKATVTGTFANTSDQVWVSGRKQDGRNGYWLLAPLRVDDGNHALLVVRGWSPQAGEFPEAPSDTVERTVVLQQGEAAAAPLDSNRVIGSVRVPALLNVLDYDLYSGFGISTTSPGTHGLETAQRPEPDVPWTAGLRNLAYAIQWWAFALFAAFMWWRMGRDLVENRNHPAEADRWDGDTGAPVA